MGEATVLYTEVLIHLFEDITREYGDALNAAFSTRCLLSMLISFLCKSPFPPFFQGLSWSNPPSQADSGRYAYLETTTTKNPYRLTGVHIRYDDRDKRRPDPVMKSASHLRFPKRYYTLVDISHWWPCQSSPEC